MALLKWKNPHYSFPAEQAAIMQNARVSVNSRRRTWSDFVNHRICSYRWGILHWSVQQRGSDGFDHGSREINYAHATHQLFRCNFNLLCSRCSKNPQQKKGGKKLPVNKPRRAGFYQPVARTDSHLPAPLSPTPLLLLVNSNCFLHSRHPCWLSILSVN